MTNKDLDLDESQQQFQNSRAKYRLSFNDFNTVVSLVKDVRALDLHIEDEKDIDDIKKICDIVYMYFPNCKIHKLSFKEGFDNDGVAFAVKIDDNKPELYVISLSQTLSIIDQYKCDMYENDSPFLKPDWNNIKYYKEFLENEQTYESV